MTTTIEAEFRPTFWTLFARRRGTHEAYIVAEAPRAWHGGSPEAWLDLVLNYHAWGYETWAKITEAHPDGRRFYGKHTWLNPDFR